MHCNASIHFQHTRALCRHAHAHPEHRMASTMPKDPKPRGFDAHQDHLLLQRAQWHGMYHRAIASTIALWQSIAVGAVQNMRISCIPSAVQNRWQFDAPPMRQELARVRGTAKHFRADHAWLDNPQRDIGDIVQMMTLDKCYTCAYLQERQQGLSQCGIPCRARICARRQGFGLGFREQHVSDGFCHACDNRGLYLLAQRLCNLSAHAPERFVLCGLSHLLDGLCGSNLFGVQQYQCQKVYTMLFALSFARLLSATLYLVFHQP
jgi:hypothetical protein